jgi:hypothetical protein
MATVEELAESHCHARNFSSGKSTCTISPLYQRNSASGLSKWGGLLDMLKL